MLKQFTKALLALSVASALTLVAAPSATAVSTSDGAQAGQHSAERAAGPCSKQWKKIRKAKRAEDRADQRLTNARKAQKKADSRGEKRTAAKKVKKARKQENVTDRKVKKAKKAYRACKNGGSGGGTGGGGGGGGTANPLQPACNAGLPQAICDAFGQLPLPGGDGGASPIQQLCDAGLPQAICDAATAPPGPGGASPIQPLCDAGLPQAVCDAAGGGTAPSPTAVCTILPIPGLCPGATSPLGLGRTT